MVTHNFLPMKHYVNWIHTYHSYRLWKPTHQIWMGFFPSMHWRDRTVFKDGSVVSGLTLMLVHV